MIASGDSDPSTSRNGIDAIPNGKTLVAIQSVNGKAVQRRCGDRGHERVDLGGATVANGDGLLLHGRTLYVVQTDSIRFLLQLSVGTIPHDRLMRAIELFGTEVVPVVRKELAGRAAPAEVSGYS